LPLTIRGLDLFGCGIKKNLEMKISLFPPNFGAFQAIQIQKTLAMITAGSKFFPFA
jgi:hypothetical protein